MSITLIDVRNPKWQTLKQLKFDSDGNEVKDSDGNNILENVTDSDGNILKVISCECKWSHLGDNNQNWLPFAADSRDTEQHGKDLYAALVNGDHGAIAAE